MTAFLLEMLEALRNAGIPANQAINIVVGLAVSMGAGLGWLAGKGL